MPLRPTETIRNILASLFGAGFAVVIAVRLFVARLNDSKHLPKAAVLLTSTTGADDGAVRRETEV